MSGRRAGYTLIELLVALLITGVGVLAAAGATAAALRVEARLDERERLVIGVGMLIDSLLAEPSPGVGTTSIGRSAVSWSPFGGGGGVVIQVATPSVQDTVRWRLTARRRPDLPWLIE